LAQISGELRLADEVPDGYQALVEYELPKAAVTLAVAMSRAKSRLEKLKLADKFSGLLRQSEVYKVPFLHPENIFLDGERIFVVHFGLEKLVAPMVRDEAQLLAAYKALVLALFSPRASFEKLVSGTLALNDKFSQKLAGFESTEDLSNFIAAELKVEARKSRRLFSLVSKRRYRIYQVLMVVAVLAALVSGYFTYSYSQKSAEQAAIISSQDYFVLNNYSSALSAMDGYQPAVIPKEARYVLAVSAVNISDLTMAQKQAILNTVSVKSDDNTLNYWIYTGRGDFDKALNLAQNLGDDQLTLLAYTNLYQTTKLNTTMDGAKKQQLLDDYTKKIQDLTKALGK